MNTLLWVLQIVLAVFFLFHAVLHVFPPAALREQLAEQNTPKLRMIANLAEILGAVGLVLPGWTGIAPWLTAVAAWGLAAIMLAAAFFHIRRKEIDGATFGLIVCALLVFVAVGRTFIETLR